MSDSEILFDRRGPLGIVTLNRPKALNALTLPMIAAFDAELAAWTVDDGVKAVVIRGAGDKAFCAGGDVVAVCREGLAERRGEPAGSLRRDFFHAEYRLNRRIKRLPKPYVALVDGISMGGGLGVSVHGSHRIVTERSLLAMPETGIGLFPDVGATHVLPGCPGRTGVFLGLTGERVKAADCVYLGLADAVVRSERIPALLDSLVAGDGSTAAIDAAIAAHAEPAGDAPLAAHRAAIDRCFAHPTVEAIVEALAAEGTEWADGVRAGLLRLSPTSLKVTLAALRRGAGQDFEDGMVMEFRLSQSCMAGNDFYEGVRALLLDKDRTPRWQPATLDLVDAALVERHFLAPADGDLSFAD